MKTVRILMRAIVGEAVDACWAATINDNQQFETAFSADVLEFTFRVTGTLYDLYTLS